MELILYFLTFSTGVVGGIAIYCYLKSKEGTHCITLTKNKKIPLNR